MVFTSEFSKNVNWDGNHSEVIQELHQKKRKKDKKCFTKLAQNHKCADESMVNYQIVETELFL